MLWLTNLPIQYLKTLKYKKYKNIKNAFVFLFTLVQRLLTFCLNIEGVVHRCYSK